jgi:predicted esterase
MSLRRTATGAGMGLLLAFASIRAIAADKVPAADSPAAVKPGQTALLASKGGGLEMRYFLRVPKSYDPKRGARLVVFLHGSNMNGLDYLRSFEAKGWCKDDILACPNGEQGSDAYGQNNFTFGSAPYVAEVTNEVKAALKTTIAYVGGHSQGGFLTYSVILNFPDLFAGALPMAGDCWSQNEPNLWETKPETLAKQKRIAIAVIHGKQDPVVSFSQGQHAYDVFRAMGYPKLRLFAPENLGHEFMLAPVADALEWLDAVSGQDATAGMRLAAKWVEQKEWGWVVMASRSALDAKKASADAKKQARSALRLAEASAKKEAIAMANAMTKSPPEEWVPKWLEFRRLFGETEAARPLIQKYDETRASQRDIGAKLFAEASSSFHGGDKEKGREKLREILKQAPASYEAYYAVSWLKS